VSSRADRRGIAVVPAAISARCATGHDHFGCGSRTALRTRQRRGQSWKSAATSQSTTRCSGRRRLARRWRGAVRAHRPSAGTQPCGSAHQSSWKLPPVGTMAFIAPTRAHRLAPERERPPRDQSSGLPRRRIGSEARRTCEPGRYPREPIPTRPLRSGRRRATHPRPPR